MGGVGIAHPTTTAQAYDKVGNLISTTDAIGHPTTYEYDDKGQQTQVTYADRTSETTVYDTTWKVILKVLPNMRFRAWAFLPLQRKCWVSTL